MTPIIVVGAGGHGRVAISLLRAMGNWNIVGVIDDNVISPNERIMDVPVIGSTEILNDVRQHGVEHAVVARGDNCIRRDLAARLRKSDFILPTLVHPAAFVDPTARIGGGTLICLRAIVGVAVEIGENCIINSGAIVDHECTVESNVHIAPGTVVGGRCRVGNGSFVGIGVVVRDGITVGAGTIIGAGAAVVANIPANVVAYGVPARVARPNSE